jgi:hypothetical protein
MLLSMYANNFNGKSEVVSFVIKFGRTISRKVNIKK